MSYCVNCGVKLDNTATTCVLCDTPVINPRKSQVETGQTPFPKKSQEVPEVVYSGLSLLITIVLASVAICCVVLNFFLLPQHLWSIYIVGAAVMFWVWLVPPLLWRNGSRILLIIWDVAALAVYLYLVAGETGDTHWYWGLALPIVLMAGAVVLVWVQFFSRKKRSILTRIVITLGGVGAFLFAIEGFIDHFLGNPWEPTWSVLVVTICIGVIIPLVIIRRVPLLREEARRRFHI